MNLNRARYYYLAKAQDEKQADRPEWERVYTRIVGYLDEAENTEEAKIILRAGQKGKITRVQEAYQEAINILD